MVGPHLCFSSTSFNSNEHGGILNYEVLLRAKDRGDRPIS